MLCAGMIMFKFCSTSCILRTCYTFYSYGVPKCCLYIVHFFLDFQHVHKASKNEKLVVILPFNSSGCKTFLFSLQIEKLLSFQAPDEFMSSCRDVFPRTVTGIDSIPVNVSWKDIPAGSTPGSTVGSMQRLVAPECWIHVWYSLDPDT